MSGKLRLKLIVHCFQFAAEAKRRHLSPYHFSSNYYSMLPGDTFAYAAVIWVYQPPGPYS